VGVHASLFGLMQADMKIFRERRLSRLVATAAEERLSIAAR
jgi:hypothetical protein